MKITVAILLLCFGLNTQAQEVVNAIGEINFGISKKEAKRTYKINKQSYYLEFGQHTFNPTIMGSRFFPGLQRLTFNHSIKDGSTGANDRESAELCLLMEEHFKSQGGKITYYNPNYPIAKNMIGSTVFLVEFEDKVIRPFVNTSIESSAKVWEYIFAIDIMTIDYYNSQALNYKSAQKK